MEVSQFRCYRIHARSGNRITSNVCGYRGLCKRRAAPRLSAAIVWAISRTLEDTGRYPNVHHRATASVAHKKPGGSAKSVRRQVNMDRRSPERERQRKLVERGLRKGEMFTALVGCSNIPLKGRCINTDALVLNIEWLTFVFRQRPQADFPVLDDARESSIVKVAVGPAFELTSKHLPPRKANRVRFPAGSHQDIRIWESCRTMPLFGEFSRGSAVSSLAIAFPRRSIPRFTLVGSQDHS
ncbi:hypothetical protein PR048_025452 [Dryococelus australis]|uniref:Uncharacterized protein n=1 Tax=Dryococelus australis TaxID=614101 RepID=A0ABQ9GRD2_9NEOP|nr:hypothetical protein PR048_025452 [Dryococelus australis]